MKVCAISFKECWRDEHGVWLTDGGFPRQMAGIASLFDAMDLVIVEVPARRGGFPLPAGANVIPVRQPYGTDARRKLSILLNLPYYSTVLLRQILSADVVHVPLPGDIPLLGMLLAIGCRKRILARYGGSWQVTGETTFMNRVTRGSMRLFAGGPNVMLATGSGTSAPAARMQWIFSTALTESEINAIRPTLDRGLTKPPEIVYAGRLAEEKGVQVLIDAMVLLRRRTSSDLHATVIGDGPMRKVLELKVAKVGLSDHVRFTGQLDRDGLSREMGKADFCVQASLTEGFSKAWIDAMAHGLPVLASEVGAARSVIGAEGERGWLVQPGNAEALANSIAGVLHSPADWPALRGRCRAYAESLTLERWQHTIGEICSRQWNLNFAEGRLAA